MKKSIGIITFHRAKNYGAVLQLYALQQVLQKNNNRVYVVDYYNKFLYKNHKLFHPFRKNLIKYLKDIFSDLKNLRKNKKRINNFDNFLSTNFKLIDVKKEEELDIVITGSDQVWNYEITGELDDYYTLNNLKNSKVKRISYAASVGNANMIIKKEKQFIEKISDINYISVREEDAQANLSKIIKKPIESVLDPTLLLDKTDWNKEITKINNKNEKYILAYVIKEDKAFYDIVNSLSEKTGLKVIHFSRSNKGFKNVLRSEYMSGPIEFVKLIKDAEYIVCTSFHATVFSILFNKRFFVVPHRTTGARVTNLLKKLNIKGRTFLNLEEFKNIDYEVEPDWKEVEEKLNYERNMSITWLKNAIND